MRRSPFLAAAAILLALGAPVAATVPAMADDGPHGSAHAVSARTTLLDKSLITVDPLPAVAYPAGDDRSVAEVGPDAAGLLSAKVLHASSQVRDGALTSRASLAEAVVRDLLRAAVVTAECRTDGREVTGTSSIAELTVLGQNINVKAEPGTKIDVLGAATVTLNEQIRDGDELTVNAVHVIVGGAVGRLASADVVLSQARCSASGPITEPSLPSTTSGTPTATTTTGTPTSTSTTPTSQPSQSAGLTTTVTTTTDVRGIVPASNEGDLAETGASGVVGMALVASLLLAGGAAVIVFSRRRRNTPRPSAD